MERTIRCTVCTWRGDAAEAELAPRARRSEIPQQVEELQDAYAAQAQSHSLVGAQPFPPCPQCGHHTTRAHRRISSRPTAL
ncbi:MAG TPA: hypothetical protein VIF62_06405 [Labilithrix sp.]|jgi:hypothetical protein